MGIPSYFKHLILNHRSIINTIDKSIILDNFYIDANSIIYDAINSTDYSKYSDNSSYEIVIITNVIVKLKELINNINPTSNIIIAFDGIPPIAKINQQRSRRYKNYLQSQLLNTTNGYSTCNISPGTNFMNTLDKNIYKTFSNLNYIVFGSDIPGEGEHKIFQYIRDNPDKHLDKNTVIYGIDADLFMISLANLKLCKNIYLYRETPEFIKSIDNTLSPNKLYIISINNLAYTIVSKLTDINNITNGSIAYYNRLDDYVFMCFILGNDFLPHFPAINIKNNGIDILIQLYNKLFYNSTGFTSNSNIVWKNFKKFIKELSENEHKMLSTVYKNRDRNEKYRRQNFDNLDKHTQLDYLPTINRNTEKFINIFEDLWEMRYYYSLLNIDIDFSLENKERLEQYNKSVTNVSINYLETLEWNFIYYKKGCPDQYHYYKYNYPPLLRDLFCTIPIFDTEFITNNNEPIINSNTLLALILPPSNHNLINKKVVNYINKHYKKYYSDISIEDIHTSFCNYLWEGHIDLVENSIYNIKKLNSEIINIL